jgi:hypothetical protein
MWTHQKELVVKRPSYDKRMQSADLRYLVLQQLKLLALSQGVQRSKL